MYISKKYLTILFLIFCIGYFGLSFENYSAVLRIGQIRISDTLNGNAKFNHGIYCDSLTGKGFWGASSGLWSDYYYVHTTNAGLSYSMLNNLNLNSQMSSNSRINFNLRNETPLSIDSINGIQTYSNLGINNFITHYETTTPPKPSASGTQIYVKDGYYIILYNYSSVLHYYYIDMVNTTNQGFTYSTTEPSRGGMKP